MIDNIDTVSGNVKYRTMMSMAAHNNIILSGLRLMASGTSIIDNIFAIPKICHVAVLVVLKSRAKMFWAITRAICRAKKSERQIIGRFSDDVFV